jgi:hypothetical protein
MFRANLELQRNSDGYTWKPSTVDKFNYTGKFIPSFILDGNKLLGAWVLKKSQK